jgi:hypothetical protein
MAITYAYYNAKHVFVATLKERKNCKQRHPAERAVFFSIMTEMEERNQIREKSRPDTGFGGRKPGGRMKFL